MSLVIFYFKNKNIKTTWYWVLYYILKFKRLATLITILKCKFKL